MEIFTLNNDSEDAIRGMLNSLGENVEFEIRFGKYIFNKETKRVTFESNVEVQFFYRLRKILTERGLSYETINTEEFIYNNFNSKGVTKCIRDINKNKQSYLYKNTFKKYDIREFDFRISLANEKILQNINLEPNTKPNCIRRKNRFSFAIDIGKIDMTIVQKYDNNSNFIQQKYEIELEINQPEYSKMMSLLSLVLQTRQENFFAIPSSERRYVFNEYKNLVGASFFIGAQAETLQKENINVLYKELYSVTDKADGERYFLFIDSAGIVFFLDSNVCSILKTNIVCKEYASSIIDGELLKYPNYISFHAFDILFFKGRDLREDTNFLLTKRLEYLEKIIINIPKNPLYTFQMKRFIFRNVFIGAEILMSSINEREYENDGLIFTPMNDTYPKKKKWSKLLKWKPSDKNSIDFYAVKTESNNGIGSWNLYVQHINTSENVSNNSHRMGSQLTLFDVDKLCNTTSDVETFSTCFMDNLIDSSTGETYQSNTVIEFVWDSSSRKFVPMRTRWDKTMNPKKHGNFSSVALNIWNNIHNPISLEFLSKFSNVSGNNFFFDKMRRYHNKIKENLYAKYCKNNNNLLELCSGRGGDLHKWIHNSIQNVTGYDINAKSVSECYRRLSEIDKNGKHSENYKFHVLDLNSETADSVVLRDASNATFESVVCQFGFHYFCKSEDSLKKIVEIIESNLKQDGHFVLTFMDNQKLNDFFGDKNMLYSTNEKNEIVYFMKREMTSSSYGNKLKVYLNGNNVLSEMSDEFVIDYNVLCELLNTYGFELVETKLFSDIDSDQFKMDNYENDISFLNRYCVFQKKKQIDVTLKNQVVEKISPTIVETTYKLIELEHQDVQLHKIESFYDIIDVVNSIEYKYNRLDIENKQIESFSDIQDLFSTLHLNYHPYFVNKMSSVSNDKSIVFYYNKYTIEKSQRDEITEYNNWYIVLFHNKLIVNSNLCKNITLEDSITNAPTPTVETPTVETPTVETLTVETPIVETPIVETPTVEIPTVETPTVETPTVETPTVETPNYESFTVKQLQEELKKLGLKVSGKKAELISRLKN